MTWHTHAHTRYNRGPSKLTKSSCSHDLQTPTAAENARPTAFGAHAVRVSSRDPCHTLLSSYSIMAILSRTSQPGSLKLYTTQ